MLDIFIWGTGNYGNVIYDALRKDKCNVCGAIDTNIDKHGKKWKEILTIYPPEYLMEVSYDYIIISTLQYGEILKKCSELNIERDKIIAYWNGDYSFSLINENLLVLQLQGTIKRIKGCLLEKNNLIKELEAKNKAFTEEKENIIKSYSDKIKVLNSEKIQAIKEKTQEINNKNNIINEKIKVIKENIALKDENFIIKLKLENAPYEYGTNNIPKIISARLLLEKLIEEHKSVSRFGDGELELMRGCARPWFQKVNDELAERLSEVFNSDREDLLIAISDNFGSLEKYTEASANAIRHYLSDGKRKQILAVIGTEREYYDAYMSRPYLMYKDKNYAKDIFELLKKLWSERNVLLVEGKYMRTGVGNDLFSTAKSVKRILCPAENAFDSYDEIMECIKKYANKEDLILLGLGPTATVLAYDISALGFQAIDLGQIDNEYEWYLMGAEERVALPEKAVPELEDCHAVEQSQNQEYLKQIIAKIGC